MGSDLTRRYLLGGMIAWATLRLLPEIGSPSRQDQSKGDRETLEGVCFVNSKLQAPGIMSPGEYDKFRASELAAFMVCMRQAWDMEWPGVEPKIVYGEWQKIPEHEEKDPETGETTLVPERHLMHSTMRRA